MLITLMQVLQSTALKLHIKYELLYHILNPLYFPSIHLQLFPGDFLESWASAQVIVVWKDNLQNYKCPPLSPSFFELLVLKHDIIWLGISL